MSTHKEIALAHAINRTKGTIKLLECEKEVYISKGREIDYDVNLTILQNQLAILELKLSP